MATPAEAQEDLVASIREMLADLPTVFPDPPAAYEPPAGPSLLERMAGVRAARRQALQSRLAANDDAAPSIAVSAPRPLSKLSKKRGSKPRRSQARDKRNLVHIKGFVPDMRPTIRDRKNGALVDDPHPTPSPSSTAPSTSPKTPTKTISKSTLKRHKANDNDTRKAPAWRYTTDVVKGHCFIRTVSTRGAGLSWTLNLGGKVLQAANDNAARFMRDFQDRLTKAIKAEFGESRDFLFAIETTAGRPHLHGAVDALEDERHHLEAILVRCGGGWDATRHAERQAHTDLLWGPDGWIRYCEKSMALTKAQLGLKSVLSVTRGCRARAEQLWESSRAASR